MEVSDATTYRSKCRSKKDVPGQYLDIALVAGQYKIYCPAMSFDPPTQSVTYVYKINFTTIVESSYVLTTYTTTSIYNRYVIVLLNQ